jgi:hypothetical protein
MAKLFISEVYEVGADAHGNKLPVVRLSSPRPNRVRVAGSGAAVAGAAVRMPESA